MNSTRTIITPILAILIAVLFSSVLVGTTLNQPRIHALVPGLFALSDELNAPQLISPSNDAHSEELRPVFTWTLVFSADNYSIQLDVNRSFSTSSLVMVDGIENNSFVPTIELTPARWYWRVQAMNITHTSPYSDIWQFSIVPGRVLPPVDFTPLILIPVAGVLIAAACVIIRRNRVLIEARKK
jgi:hypothetical protein